MATQSETIQFMETNRRALLSSKVLGKAVLRQADGKIWIVAVYALSTHYDFYWTYESSSKNKRAPKSKWGKPRGSFARDYSTHDHSVIGFENFVAHFARPKKQVLSMRVYSKRAMAQVQKQPAHQSISTDWNRIEPRISSYDTQYLNRKLAANIKGRMVNSDWRR